MTASIWSPGGSPSTSLQVTLANFAGAGMIGFMPTGIGAQPTTIQDALNKFDQKPSGRIFSNEGARLNKLNDRLFVGPTATKYDGSAVPAAGAKSWVCTPSGGIFQYMEVNATLAAYAEGSGLGMFSAARTSATQGTPGEIALCVGAFAYNDKPGSLGGAWCFYGTALREAGAKGSTLGIEIDIANLGATAVCWPAQIVPEGVSAGLWIASGGEAVINDHVGVASAALVILSNDYALHPPIASFEKGIVFHNQSLAGCDGASGSAFAIAMARGHTIGWFSNANAAIGYIGNSVDTPAKATNINFSDAGFTVTAADNTQQFQVKPVTSAVNFLQVEAGIPGGKVHLNAVGTDPNIDMLVVTKGTGVLQVNYPSTAAASTSAFKANRCLPFKDGNDVLWYIPISTTPW